MHTCWNQADRRQGLIIADCTFFEEKQEGQFHYSHYKLDLLPLAFHLFLISAHLRKRTRGEDLFLSSFCCVFPASSA
jgi:hypothetical protein